MILLLTEWFCDETECWLNVVPYVFDYDNIMLLAIFSFFSMICEFMWDFMYVCMFMDLRTWYDMA